MPEQTTKLHEDLTDLGNNAIRKASGLSISMAVIVFSLIGTLGAFLYFNKDTVVRLFEISHDVQHLQAAHDKCHEEMAALKGEVLQLRQEVKELKTKLNIAQN